MTQPAPAITPEIVAEHGLSPEEYERVLAAIGREPNLVEESRAKAAVHLARHTPEAVVDAYLDAIGAMFPQLRLRK